MGMKINRGGARVRQEGSTKLEGQEQNSRSQGCRETDTSHLQLAPYRKGETFLSSEEARIESSTAAAGFLACSGAEDMLLHLDRATFSMQMPCPAPGPDPLPIARAVTAAPSASLCSSRWTPDSFVFCHSCLHHWMTKSTMQDPPACFLLPCLVLLHSPVVVPHHVGSLWLCTVRRD